MIWFIHNTAGITDLGHYKLASRFNPPTEELRGEGPTRFRGKSADEIRAELDARAREWQPFWFRQGYDLAALNTLDEVARLGMRVLRSRAALPSRRFSRPDRCSARPRSRRSHRSRSLSAPALRGGSPSRSSSGAIPFTR